MFDFGSMLGSGTNEEDHPWVGREYVVEPRPALATLASLGLWRRPFIRVKAPSHLAAAGNFTADGFRPHQWKPHYPNAAFTNMQPEDAIWAARLVAAFTPDVIARIVEKAQFTDSEVVDHVTGTLQRRRELVLRTWLTAMNPLWDAAIGPEGMLRFNNAAVDGHVAERPQAYELAWFRYDNETGRRHYVASSRTEGEPVAPVPTDKLTGAEYFGVDIGAAHADYRAWRTPVRFYFHAEDGRIRAVGVERRPDAGAERYARK
jgi:hypothetical protein